MKSKLILLLHTFAILSGTAVSDTLFQLDFGNASTVSQPGWQTLGGTGNISGSFPGFTGLAAGNITVSLTNIAFDRLYRNGTGAPDDFPGTDLDNIYSDLVFRNNTGTPINITIGGLLAGTYTFTTHHLNAVNTPSRFNLDVQDADSLSFGQSAAADIAMGLGLGAPSFPIPSFNPTVISFDVVSNGTDPIILRMTDTFIGTGGNTGGWWGINGLEIIPAPANTFQLIITETSPPATGYDFQWVSQPGMVYDLLTSLDLATPIADWPVYGVGGTLYEAIPSAGETTTLTAVPSADPRRFFAVREYVAPPPPPPPIEPELSSVWGSGTSITLNFTEGLEETAATAPLNYEVFNLDVFWPVTAAVLSPDGKTVTLTLGSALAIDTTFSVTLSNLTGSDGTPLGGNTTVQFQTWDNDPDGIKVFILAGQSNMVGFGHSETGNGGIAGAIGSLRHLAVNNTTFPEYDYASLLVNPADPANSAWRTRGDVKAWWRDGGANLGGTVRKGDLGPPFLGSNTNLYGPEYAFGQVIGDYYLSDDVLVIKAAWGGRSLAVDFRPPSAVAARGGVVGPFYQAIFDYAREVLGNLGTEFPQWSGTGYQIVGFGWHQGWNDRVNQTYNDEYEANMENFINDVRTELGKPVLPFVIATTGMSGWAETHPRALSLMNAQLAMANFTKYPDFEGNVDVIDTRDFWRDAAVSPVNQGFHWNQNGETMFLIGKSMGDRMVNLLAPSE